MCTVYGWLQFYVAMSGWIKSAATHYIEAKYSRRVIYQPRKTRRQGVESVSCHDGSKQKGQQPSGKAVNGSEREREKEVIEW